ncbi:hypothetical protein GCM10023149_28870 [Mucilaginibacter gynuensis]|uniref:SusD-like starch-binding protein associating with outer membrane n=1 Tax=Mucilaginibacter gynuensis TaxID=1302236 RepID=A0ABP8GL45_9SPHI
MKKNKPIHYLLFFLFAAALGAGCGKDFLEKKPSKALLVPATPADFRALLDNNQVFNYSPALTSLADGDLVVSDAGFNGYGEDYERTSYTWAKEIFTGSPALDWSRPYQQVFYANIVLDGLNELKPATSAAAELNVIKGTALFYRAYAFFNLAQQFALPYRQETADADPGIPLPLSSPVVRQLPRASLAVTYDRILTDLREARRLLPSTAAYKSRPVTAAAFGMLARVNLAMENYAAAGRYADSCLELRSALIDYNTLNPTANRPFPSALPNGNDEVIWYAVDNSYSFATSASPTVADLAFYNSFHQDDLRKGLFFRPLGDGTFRFKGSYTGNIFNFSGLAADEIWLIRAECRARAGETAGALSDLNTLLEKRWLAGKFNPVTAADAEAALRKILEERRKELFRRGQRWSDLRRLNRYERLKVTLTRIIAGQTYTLLPESKRYVYPIPPEEIRLNNIPQNER